MAIMLLLVLFCSKVPVHMVIIKYWLMEYLDGGWLREVDFIGVYLYVCLSDLVTIDILDFASDEERYRHNQTDRHEEFRIQKYR